MCIGAHSRRSCNTLSVSNQKTSTPVSIFRPHPWKLQLSLSSEHVNMFRKKRSWWCRCGDESLGFVFHLHKHGFELIINKRHEKLRSGWWHTYLLRDMSEVKRDFCRKKKNCMNVMHNAIPSTKRVRLGILALGLRLIFRDISLYLNEFPHTLTYKHVNRRVSMVCE